MEIRGLERTLKALANRRRLGILKSLQKHERAVVGQIAQDIKLSFKATSKHLGILYAADLVEREQKSLEMWYSISPRINSVAKYISNSLE